MKELLIIFITIFVFVVTEKYNLNITKALSFEKNKTCRLKSSTYITFCYFIF